MSTSEHFLDRLRGTTPLYGVWTSLPGTVPAELAAGTGVDYVVVDLQHGAATEADLPAMCAAVTAAGAYPLVRARSKDATDISRPLDLGAHGVIVPSTDSVADAVAAVGACTYPPAGSRSFGRLRPGPPEPACVVMVESRSALDAVEDLVRVPGVHAVYVGPWDLGLSLGVPPGDLTSPVLSAAVDRVLAAAAGAGLAVGVHAASGPAAARLRGRGCRLVTVAADVTALTSGIAAELAAARTGTA